MLYLMYLTCCLANNTFRNEGINTWRLASYIASSFKPQCTIVCTGTVLQHEVRRNKERGESQTAREAGVEHHLGLILGVGLLTCHCTKGPFTHHHWLSSSFLVDLTFVHLLLEIRGKVTLLLFIKQKLYIFGLPRHLVLHLHYQMDNFVRTTRNTKYRLIYGT